MTTITVHPVYIAHVMEQGEPFRAHLTNDNGNTTLCGLSREDWPDIIYTDGSTEPGDKAWYADHDRPDVEGCVTCIELTGRPDWISPPVGTAARMRDDSRLRHGRLA